ncbi:MAG: hypothetical protein WC484_06155 [Candidatus Omnitrophota bacterium]
MNLSETKSGEWRKIIAVILVLTLLGGGGGGGYIVYSKYMAIVRAATQGDLDASETFLRAVPDRLLSFLTMVVPGMNLIYEKFAGRCLEAKRFEQCRRFLEFARQKFPQDPTFVAQLGIVFYRLKDYQGAARMFDELQRMKYFSTFLARNERNYLLLAAQFYAAAGQKEKSASFEKVVLEKYANDSTIWLTLARVAAFQGKLGNMIDQYQRAQAASDREFEWADYFLLAAGYIQIRYSERFFKTFAKAKRRFPNAPGFFLLLSLEHIGEGKFLTAYYELLLEKESGLNYDHYFEKAIGAIEREFAKAFERRPSEPWYQNLYWFIRSKQFLEKGEKDRALECLFRSLKAPEVHPLQYLYLARLLRSMGKVEEALGYYEKTATATLHLSCAYAEAAEIHLERNETKMADILWQRAVEADPGIVRFSEVGKKLQELSAFSSFSTPSKPASISVARPITVEAEAPLVGSLPDAGLRQEINFFIQKQFSIALAKV